MKKLLFAILLLVGISAQAQTIVNDNPYKVDPSSTATFYIDLSNFTHYKEKGFFNLTIRTPAGNVGNVRINTESSSMTNAPNYLASLIDVIRVSGNRIYFSFDNAADFVWITF